MKNSFYTFIICFLFFSAACSLSPVPVVSPDSNSQINLSARRSNAEFPGEESNGIIFINLANVSTVKIKCNQCHGINPVAVSKNIQSDFNEIHKSLTNEFSQIGYPLPLDYSNILVMKKFIQSANSPVTE